MEREHLTELRQILVNRFSESELQDLYFDLGIGYATLTSKGKADKARELVKHCERHNRIQELVQTGKRLRPDITWPEIPKPTGESPPLNIQPSDDVSPPLHVEVQTEVDQYNKSTIVRIKIWWGAQSDAVKAAYIGLLGTLIVAFCGLFSGIPGKALDVLLGREGTKVAMLTPTPTNTSTPTSTPTATPTSTPTPTPTQTPTPTYTPTPTPDVKATLVSLIETEKEAVLTQDLDLIKNIFTSDATKTDAAIPKSWNAIQRYAETLTTEKYLDVTHTNFDFTIAADEATVTNDSCGSYIIVATGQRVDFNCPQCDQWIFHRDTNGRWWITDLTYGLVSTAPFHRYTFEDDTNGCWTVRYEGGQPQGQIPTHMTERAYQSQGSIRFVFDLRGQTIRYNMPFAGKASAYVYAPSDAPTDLAAGFFAMELDHAPWNYHDADKMVQLTPGQWTQITWNVDTSGWEQPLHLFGIEVRRASGGSYNGYVLIDEVLIQSLQ